jgi:hypothetical protein
MQILGLLGMYFDAVVVEVKKNLLSFRYQTLDKRVESETSLGFEIQGEGD